MIFPTQFIYNIGCVYTYKELYNTKITEYGGFSCGTPTLFSEGPDFACHAESLPVCPGPGFLHSFYGNLPFQ